MTLASIITLARIAMIPLFMWSMGWNHPAAAALSFGLFAAASLTDFVDGFIARRYNQVTNFGKFVDPLADKLLVTAALLMLLAQGKMAAWVVMIVLAREFCITTLRTLAMERGRVIAASLSAKIKTLTQMGGILLLLTPAGEYAFASGLSAGDVVGWALAAVTLWSGVLYIVKNRDVLRRDETPAPQKDARP